MPARDAPAAMAVVFLALVVGDAFTAAAVALSVELELGVTRSVVNCRVVNAVATWVVNRVVVD